MSRKPIRRLITQERWSNLPDKEAFAIAKLIVELDFEFGLNNEDWFIARGVSGAYDENPEYEMYNSSQNFGRLLRRKHLGR